MVTTLPAAIAIQRFRDVQTEGLTDVILSAFECQGITDSSAVYVSTPITSGEAILEWHEKVYAGAEKRRAGRHTELVQANLVNAAPFVSKVRTKFFDATVIEPTKLLDVPGFDQPDYHRLWCAFIERYARVVVFNAGWELSSGCAAEFTTAATTGKVLLDASFSELSIPQGLQSLRDALVRLRTAHRPVNLHIDAIHAIETYLKE